jgi:hypothetical protein
MKLRTGSTTLFLACAVSASLTGTARAGQCTTEIDSVSKFFASRDAGSGPTVGAAGSAAGQHPPTAAMSAADPSTAGSTAAAESAKPQQPPTAAMTQAMPGSGLSPQPREASKEQHPPTAAMGQATQGGAASPQDVQRQTRGEPTAAQQAEGAQRPAATNLTSAQAALQRAREFDAGGRETECMGAVGEAKGFAR